MCGAKKNELIINLHEGKPFFVSENSCTIQSTSNLIADAHIHKFVQI